MTNFSRASRTGRQGSAARELARLAKRSAMAPCLGRSRPEKPERVKVRAPTLANTQSVARMLEDGYLADLPIVIAAIDPCFSCNDRAVEVRRLPRGVPRVLEERATRTEGLLGLMILRSGTCRP